MCFFGCSLNHKNRDTYYDYDHIAIVLALRVQYRTLFFFSRTNIFFLIPTMEEFKYIEKEKKVIRYIADDSKFSSDDSDESDEE